VTVRKVSIEAILIGVAVVGLVVGMVASLTNDSASRLQDKHLLIELETCRELLKRAPNDERLIRRCIEVNVALKIKQLGEGKGSVWTGLQPVPVPEPQ
jgi:hypothetical protein